MRGQTTPRTRRRPSTSRSSLRVSRYARCGRLDTAPVASRRRQSMIILPPPRICNAGGFLDSDAIDVEHMQQRRFVAIHIRAYLTKSFLVPMERYLERGVVTPEADLALRRIAISACVRKMERHRCSH